MAVSNRDREILFFVLVILCFLSLPVFADPQPNAIIGTVTELRGQAFSNGEALAIGAVVPFGSRLEVRGEGGMIITFNDQSRLAMGSNSTVTADSFVFDMDPEFYDKVLSGVTGVFRFVGGDVSKPQTYAAGMAPRG